MQGGAEWVDSLAQWQRLFEMTGLGVGAVLALAAILTVTTATTLVLHARRDEMEIMRLVGATETVIRLPLLLQGMAQGLLGAAAALAALGRRPYARRSPRRASAHAHARARAAPCSSRRPRCRCSSRAGPCSAPSAGCSPRGGPRRDRAVLRRFGRAARGAAPRGLGRRARRGARRRTSTRASARSSRSSASSRRSAPRSRRPGSGKRRCSPSSRTPTSGSATSAGRSPILDARVKKAQVRRARGCRGRSDGSKCSARGRRKPWGAGCGCSTSSSRKGAFCR